jgi:hypothetical protein
MLFGECDRALRRRPLALAPPVPRQGDDRASVGRRDRGDRPRRVLAALTGTLDDRRCP